MIKDKLHSVFVKIKNILLYGGINKEDYEQIKKDVSEDTQKTLTYWSIVVSIFWIYCLVVSLNAEDYRMCRPAYTYALIACIVILLCSQFVVTRFPNTLFLFKFIFRLSLLGGGIGIAVCQWNMRSLTMFAVAIVSPSIFIDSTLSSIIVHLSALVVYIIFGRNTISPEIYYWGLQNYILFSIFGLIIGNAINKQRFERYVYSEIEKKMTELQMHYAYYDQMTGLKNRRAYEEKLLSLAEDPPAELCVVMADINGLKDINDTLGHDAGDELITGAAKCLSDAFEETDSIYRIGGDEFCVIMTGTMEKTQLCLTRLEELTSKRKGRYIGSISFSTGAASNSNKSDIKAIVSEADRNMYENKRNYYLTRGIDRRKH